MASLVGQQLKDTYDSLLKTSDNDALGGTYKEITDGAGNGSNLYLGTGGRLGIGTSSPSAKIEVEDGDFARIDLNLANATGTTITDIRGLVTGTEKWRIGKTGSSSDDFTINVTSTERMRIDSGGDISFRDTSNNEAFYWDASTARLGLGTTSPAFELDVIGDVSADRFVIRDSGGGARLLLDIDANNDTILTTGTTTESRSLVFNTENTERMRIDSSGKVGIGDSTIANPFSSAYSNILHVGTTSGNTRLAITAGTGKASDLQFADSNTSAESGTYAGYISYKHTSDDMAFGTAASEKMRILSSGGITFNGDTASSNALDDYEEGTTDATFTATTSGTITATTTLDRIEYTKIGDICHVQGTVYVSSVASPVGDVRINCLPFLSKSIPETADFLSANVLFYDGTTYSQANATITPNVQYITVHIDASTLVASDRFFIQATYKAV